MDRRDFLKTGGPVVAGGLLADLGFFEAAASAAAEVERRPNIVFVLVDEMRFPSVLPSGVNGPEEFLRRFMPNVFELWRHGVKFERYYSAGNACSPARATLATGLYPHQEWLLATRTKHGPALQPSFPTYGKVLQALGTTRRTSANGICQTRLRTGSTGIWRITASPALPTLTRLAPTIKGR